MKNETQINIDQLRSFITSELVEKAKDASNNSGFCAVHPHLFFHILNKDPHVAAADVVNIMDLAIQKYKQQGDIN